MDFKDDLKKCIDVLFAGGVILYPTETVWGLGCDAKNEEAVKRIFEIKQRVDSKNLISILPNSNFLGNYVTEVPEIAWELLDCADSPLTIVYPAVKNIANSAIAPDGSAGIRLIEDKNEFAHQLGFRFKKAIISTSANLSGEKTPTQFSDIHPSILSQVDYVVNLPELKGSRKASAIIKLQVNGEVEIIRK